MHPKHAKNWPLRFDKETHDLYLAQVDDILAVRRTLDESAERAMTEARALLEAEQWPEATQAFGDIALANPREDVGMVSAMLYIEGLILLATAIESPRQDCISELEERFPQLQRIYCEDGKNRRHPQECYRFYKIERDLEHRPSCWSNAEPVEPPEVIYARGGAHYLALARRCLEVAQVAGISPLDEQCDDFAFYAARAFLRVPDRAGAGEARELLVNPKYGMDQSPHVEELEKLWK